MNTGTFDFEMFLVKFSCIVYPALIGILTAKKCGVRSWSLDSLCSELLKVRVNQKRMLENNGELLLLVIDSKVQAWKNSQQLLNDADYDMMKNRHRILAWFQIILIYIFRGIVYMICC